MSCLGLEPEGARDGRRETAKMGRQRHLGRERRRALRAYEVSRSRAQTAGLHMVGCRFRANDFTPPRGDTVEHPQGADAPAKPLRGPPNPTRTVLAPPKQRGATYRGEEQQWLHKPWRLRISTPSVWKSTTNQDTVWYSLQYQRKMAAFLICSPPVNEECLKSWVRQISNGVGC